MNFYNSNRRDNCRGNRRPPRKMVAIQKAYKNVCYAQRMLLAPDLNHRYRAVSYLRLCCSAISHCRAEGADLAPELDAKQPYLKLLRDFYRHDAFWVTKCEVSNEGGLMSSDPEINRSLQRLQRCILQICLDHRALQEENIATQPLHAVT